MININQVQTILRNLRINPINEEYDLQQIIADELSKAGIVFKREFHIGKGIRFDFYLDGGIVIEVKKGKPAKSKVVEQLERYASKSIVTAIILVVERNLDIPKTINSKPCISFGLNKLWGIAL